jgi:hypothetical protein
MKLLAVLLIIMIAAQPVQARFCDMEPSGDAATHAGMQHHATTDSAQAHDCCDPERSDTDSGTSDCNGNASCGFCVAGVSAALIPGQTLPAWTAGQQFVISKGDLATRHPAPPLRPPIINS